MLFKKWTALKGINELFILRVNDRCHQLNELNNVFFSSRWQLIDVITEKLSDCPEEQETWKKSVTTAALKCLITAYSHSKEQSAPLSEQEKNVLDRLQQLLVGSCSSHMLRVFRFTPHAFHNLCSLHRRHPETSLHLSGTVLSRMDWSKMLCKSIPARKFVQQRRVGFLFLI